MTLTAKLVDELRTPAHTLTFAELNIQRHRAADLVENLRAETLDLIRDRIQLRNERDVATVQLVAAGEHARQLEHALLDLVRATSLLTDADGSSDALFTLLDRRVAACRLLGVDPAGPDTTVGELA